MLSAAPPFLDTNDVQHSDCVWVFAAQNVSPEGAAMKGRPEHVDEVDHAGTYTCHPHRNLKSKDIDSEIAWGFRDVACTTQRDKGLEAPA